MSPSYDLDFKLGFQGPELEFLVLEKDGGVDAHNRPKMMPIAASMLTPPPALQPKNHET